LSSAIINSEDSGDSKCVIEEVHIKGGRRITKKGHQEFDDLGSRPD